MTSPLSPVDLARLLSETPHKILQQAQEPLFLVQMGVILLAGVVGYWLGRAVHGAVMRIAETWRPHPWRSGILRGVDYVAMPTIWLSLLWIAEAAGIALSIPLHFIGAAIDLVFAWICIRLLSFSVSSQAASVTISIIAWTVAALNILDLYRPLDAWLKTVPVYESKSHHISLFDAASAIFVLTVLLWLTRLLYHFLQRQIAGSQSLTPSLQVLLSQLLQIVLPALAVIIGLQTVGFDLTTLNVAFGAIGLGVGLGLQKIVSNLVAGLTLLLGKTIKPGDTLAYKQTFGIVTGMGARYVTLRTLGGVEHLIPNDHFLENGVENWSYSDVKLCLNSTVGISYDNDPHQALAVCVAAAKSVSRVLADPKPSAAIKEFGDSAIVLEVYFWVTDPEKGTSNVKSAVLLAIWDSFKENGISMPYPHRDVRVISMPEPPASPTNAP